MEKINKNANTVLNEIKKRYGESSDLNTRIIKKNKTNIGIIFMESSSSTESISNFIIKAIDYTKDNTNIFSNLYTNLKNNIFNSQILTTKDFSQFPYYLSAGFTIIVVDNSAEAIVMETRAQLDRGVTESTSEPILRGPKDSFTESHAKNLGLIRKRIKDSNLWFKEVKVGKRTKTRISIAYINDIVDEERITKIEKKLKEINIDGVLDSGNIREYLLKSCIEKLKKENINTIQLTCNKSRTHAQKLYQKHGFESVDTIFLKKNI